MNRCKNCKHFEPVASRDEEPAWAHAWGHCGRWRAGYGISSAECQPNEVIVEDDEGWGAMMGPDFGCVFWEPK